MCPTTRRSELMAAAQAGDSAAYATLLRECVPLIKLTAHQQGVPADRLDDVVQDVLLTVHRARHTYDPRRPFDTWLRVIAQRRARDAHILKFDQPQPVRDLQAAQKIATVRLKFGRYPGNPGPTHP